MPKAPKMITLFFIIWALDPLTAVCYYRPTLLPIRQADGSQIFRVSPSKEIANLKESIDSLSKELYINEQGDYVTRLAVSFITAAGVSFKTLNPNDLPADNVALDVYLLRGQNLLLTKNYAFNDEVLNMIFSGFTTLIKTMFQQTVVPVS